jgi:hypothetical protein
MNVKEFEEMAASNPLRSVSDFVVGDIVDVGWWDGVTIHGREDTEVPKRLGIVTEIGVVGNDGYKCLRIIRMHDRKSVTFAPSAGYIPLIAAHYDKLSSEEIRKVCAINKCIHPGDFSVNDLVDIAFWNRQSDGTYEALFGQIIGINAKSVRVQTFRDGLFSDIPTASGKVWPLDNMAKGKRVEVVKTINNSLYCSCDGSGKENWAGGEKFVICTACYKEKR